MNNNICNPKTEVPNGIQLNDKDYCNSLLSCLKEMQKNYVTAISEASNEFLFQKYHQTFQTISSLQREVYELMFRNGWYTLEQAEKQKINQKHQMLNQELQSLNQ